MTAARPLLITREPALVEEVSRWSANYTASEILAKVLADPGPGTIVFGPVNRPTQTLAESHWWERGCFARLHRDISTEERDRLQIASTAVSPLGRR